MCIFWALWFFVYGKEGWSTEQEQLIKLKPWIVAYRNEVEILKLQKFVEATFCEQENWVHTQKVTVSWLKILHLKKCPFCWTRSLQIVACYLKTATVSLPLISGAIFFHFCLLIVRQSRVDPKKEVWLQSQLLLALSCLDLQTGPEMLAICVHSSIMRIHFAKNMLYLRVIVGRWNVFGM